jgi:glutamyl-tRNA synthetase
MVVVRVAPSPTGDPHVGTAYVSLFNYALRRKRGGRFILRIDDTDRARYRADSEAAILKELAWLGLSWDEGPDVGGPAGPYRQSERTELYRQAAEELIQKGAAYRCDCSPERLEKLREEQQKRKEQPRYDGHCRNLAVPPGPPHVVRLKVPHEGETTFRDGLRGRITIAHQTIDDQVLMKSDGYPTYHLATVVDDHRMGVTHILRAEEWINSTPKHVLLYQAFGWPLPEWYHLPLLRNPDRSKISKRKNPTSITWYRESGFLPEAMLNFLALMGFALGEDREVFSLEEFVQAFEPDAIKASGPIFDLAKLEWLNGVYIRQLAPAELARRIREASPLARDADPAKVLATVPLVQERMKKLTEFEELCDFLFREPAAPAVADLVPKGRTPAESATMLGRARETLATAPFEAKPLEEALRQLAEASGWKARDLLMTLRFAVSGKKVTPPIIESMCVLGRETCVARAAAAAALLENPVVGEPRTAP